MLGFNQETIKQPETIYAIAGASLLSGALIFGFELGIAGSLGAIMLGAMVAPIFRFVVQFANKIKLIVDHADEVVTKAKSKIEDLDVLKETLTTTVKEANQTLKDVKKNTLPEANKAIKHTSKTVKDLQILVDDITKNTLPAITTVAKDVHGTMEYVNSGAQTASTLMTPVTVSGKLLRKAGTMVGLGQSEKAVEKTADPAPEKAPLPPPKMQTRHSMRQQKKAQPITPAAQKTKKGQPKLKELAKNAQAEVEQKPAPQTGFFSRLKFW